MKKESSLLLQSQTSFPSQNVLIGFISFVFILVILYPWIIAVTVICFVVGFICIEQCDKFIKLSVSNGKFGSNVQAYFKDYINERSVLLSLSSDASIKEVSVDPLRDYLELDELRRQSITHQKQSNNEEVGTRHGQGIQVHHSLAIPEAISSSNRSSPEKNKSSNRESPIPSLSAVSSRRVSEDLLHVNNSLGLGGGLSLPSSRRESNKTPSPSKSSTHESTPSPSLALSAEIGTLRIDQEFRVDVRIDKAFGRLFTNILNYYISPSWAPYETRRQLRLSFKQLLNGVAERINKKLLVKRRNSEYIPLVKITRQKAIPLLLYYVEKILSRGLSGDDLEDPIISSDGKRRLVLKLRKFSRRISERFLNKDDKNSKLWLELFVAVLADGVFVNVMELGRDKLPELFEELITNYRKLLTSSSTVTTKVAPGGATSTSSTSPAKSVISTKEEGRDRHLFSDPLTDHYPEDTLTVYQKEETSSLKSDVSSGAGAGSALGFHSEMKISSLTTKDKVPFLLDSFLDPPFSLEKPDPIVSRWRPTLKDIVSETDLLYPLIQYMKHIGGQQSLAYLQGVLDDFPQEGDPYCRRVLELEYIPGFCRSSLLLETMGLNRVEMALEVGTDSLNMRRNSNNGHIRSASYGGISSSSFREFLRIEQGIVDGFPMTESGSHLNSISSSSSDNQSAGSTGSGSTGASATLPGAGVIEPSLAFKRRPHLEMYIAKFIKSTTKSWKQYYDPLADKSDPVKRVGIDPKSYEEWDHPNVNSRVKIHATNEDIYDSFVEIVTTLMRDSPIANPLLSSLANFLKPYIMPLFDSQLDKNLSKVLSVDLLIIVVDLIAEVFEESQADDVEMGMEDVVSQKVGEKSSHEYQGLSDDTASNPEEDTSQRHSSSCTSCDPGFKSTIKLFLIRILECFTAHSIDLDYFVKCFKKNREYIFLFFVDLLDIIVSVIVEE